MPSPRGTLEREPRRGDVFLADLWSQGGRLLKKRPVLVVQNDIGNIHSLETIVAGIRSADRPRRVPVVVLVSRGTAGLVNDSHVDAGQLLTVLKTELGRRLGTLPPELLTRVDQALRISLGLVH